MGIADEMNSEIAKGVTKEDFKDYVYVMISTLNQMVNYIPLKHFEFSKIYNITINDSVYVENQRWDSNLSDVLGEQGITIDKTIEFKQTEITDIQKIINKLEEELKDKKVFWNITGGQRAFILAINQLAKEEDVICYLEGNTNQMVLLKNNKEIEDMVEDYGIEDLNIETALKLMGFEVKETKTSYRNLIKEYDEKEKKFYLKFLDEYIKNEKLRENLILLNRNNKKKEETKKNIKGFLRHLNYSKIDVELDRNKAFGYILEKLAGYKILELAKDKIADLTFGEKISYSDPTKKVDNAHIDEFDIALLTKNGKFIIFECKSGNMDGDVAKSTKYSTYAVSGAYGLPILITPLFKGEIEDIDSLDSKIYGYIQKAVKSAKRASLDVWGLDEIEEKLKKYIKL